MDKMTDRELDQLLGLATKPVPATDSAARTAARAFAQVGKSNIVAFAPKAKPSAPKFTISWLAALPLAASLAAGVYLGALGSGSYVLPEILGGGAWTDEDAVLSGVEDMEELTDEDVS